MNGRSSASRRKSLLGGLALVALMAVAYFVAGRLGLLLAIPPGYATAIWPPAGIALAMVLWRGGGVLPGVLLGSFAVNLSISLGTVGEGWREALPSAAAVAASIGLGASLQAVFAVWLVRRFAGFPNPLVDTWRILAFLALAGPVGCLVGATWGTVTLVIAGAAPAAGAAFTWLTWWVGDSMGVLLLTPLAMLAYGPAAGSARLVRVGAPMLLTFVASVAVFAWVSQRDIDRRQLDFERRAVEMSHRLKQGFSGYLDALHAASILFGDDREPTPAEFRRFALATLARYPELDALAYDECVTGADRPAFEAAMREQGFSYFVILDRDREGRSHTAGERSEYVVIKYIEPSEKHVAAMGVDAYSLADRRRVMDQARDSGRVASTDGVRLVQRPDRIDGLVFLQPVYRRLSPSAGVAERRQSIEGYVAGVISLGDVVERALDGLDCRDIAWSIDAEAADATSSRLFAAIGAQPAENSKPLAFDDGSIVHRSQIAGRSWVFRFSDATRGAPQSRSWEPWFALVTGLSFTHLLGAFLLIVTGQNQRAEELVRSRTADLATANAQLKAVFDASSQTSIIATDATGLITIFNAGAEKMLGYRAEEMIGLHTPALVHAPEEIAALGADLSQRLGYPVEGLQVFAELVGRAGYVQNECTYIAKGGRRLTVNLVITAQRNLAGQIVGYLGVATDMTDRKRMQERFQRLVESSPSGMVMSDARGRIVLVNRQAEQMFGYSREEMVGQPLEKLLPQRYRADHPLAVRRYFEQPSVRPMGAGRDLFGLHKNGHEFPVEIGLNPIEGDDGPMVLSAIVDISERKQRAAALAEASGRLKAVFDASTQTSIIAGDPKGVITVFNTGAEKMLGYSAEEMVGRATPQIIHDADEVAGRGAELSRLLGYPVQGFDVFVELARRGGHEEREWTYITKSGRRLTVNLIVTAQRDAEGRITGFLGVATDITERKRLECVLRESAERLQMALDNAKHGMWEWNVVTGEVALDDNWHAILGYAPGELPLQVDTWENGIHPDDREYVFAVLQRHLKSPDTLYDVEYRSRHKNGDWIWLNTRGRVHERDAAGAPLRMMGTIHDITSRKFAEESLVRRAEELARSNAELEQFAYVASHDLREPLRMVQSFCSLLKDRYSGQLDVRANKYIDFAVDGAARMQRLIDDLLEYSRVGRSNERFDIVSLGEIARQATINLSVAVADTGARIEIGPLPQAIGDAARLEQVFQNLIGNALKFRREGTVPNVRVSASETSDGWRITVADNGIGVAPEDIERLFVVFQRLHARSEFDGTGIGLALCKRIIELHQGRIWLESEVGLGTEFHFTLPPAPEQDPGGNGRESNREEPPCLAPTIAI